MDSWVPQKILFLLFNQVDKGTYWRGFGFAQALAKNGHDVVLLAASPTRKRGFLEKHVGQMHLVETPDLCAGSGYDVWDTLNRIYWLRKRPFDIIHAFETRPINIFPALSVQKKTSGVLFTDWCDWFGKGGSVEQRSNPFMRNMLRPVETFFEEHYRTRASGTTVINQVLQQKAINLGIAPNTVLHLPNGANVNEIRPQDKSVVRERLGLSVNVPILAYTGAIFREDARLLALAFAQVNQIHPETKLLLIGYNNIALETWIPELASSVIRTGQISFRQLGEYIAAADIGVLPLKNNGANQGRFPMKLFDFMAAARPVVVTDVADVGALVREKQMGLVAPDKPSPLAATISELLKDAEWQKEMGRNGRFVAENEFAWPVVTKQLESFYQKILAAD